MSSDQADPADVADPLPPPNDPTSAGNLLTVALRILGFWFVFRSLIAIPQIAAIAAYSVGPSSPFGGNLMSTALIMVVPVVSHVVVGIAVILLAGRITRRFYPSNDLGAGPITFGRVGAGDLYHIGSFMMGVYLLVQAVAPGVRFLAGTMDAPALAAEPWADGGAVNLITAAVYSLSGIGLIFGARGIAQAMSAIPHDSDKVPVVQFSIRSLLILGVVFAVLLGVLRAVTVAFR